MRWVLGWLLPAALLLGGLASPRALRAQISPGPLASAHRELEGSLKCTSCHGGRKEPMATLCVACHKDIQWLAAQGRGLHAREGKTDCQSCHPDHAGTDFALIKWPDGSMERFDHRRTGWTLEGSHRDVKCSACHKPEFRIGPAAKLSRHAGTPPGWVGLEQSCTGCHEDIHRGALGTDCTKCHDTGKWKTTPGFDHAKTEYPLTGKHLEVACVKCHLDPRLGLKQDAQGRSIPVYQPVPHQQCSACHQDPHAGRLGTSCSDCHNTRGFKGIDKQTFNHERTRYPLRGRHAQVTCTKCHDFNTPAGKKPPFGTCSGCHRDAHAGSATLAGKAADCEACHRVEGFEQPVFTVAQHQQTRFPLVEKHQGVRCTGCHLKSPPGTPVERLGSSGILMRPSFATCTDCHSDQHGGQLAARSDRGTCSACHTLSGWKPTSYSTAAHAKLRVTLAGRHGAIPCAACHGPDRKDLPPLPGTTVSGKAGVVFALKELDCAACHNDPHGGRYAAKGARPMTGGCAGCHTQSGFRPSTVSLELHQRFAFPLEGAHRAVPCVACHSELKTGLGGSTLLLSATRPGARLVLTLKSRACVDCHSSPHGDQFASRKDGGACESCHGVEAFAPASNFDHDRDAGFKLKGAHSTVPCNRCHPTDLTAPNRSRLIFRPVSGKCENCHGEKS